MRGFGYTDDRTSSRLRKFLALIGDDPNVKVWLTEQGSFARKPRSSGQAIDDPVRFQSEQRVAAETQDLLTQLPKVDSRISRVYVYNWKGQTDLDGQDSGLLAPENGNNTARLAYNVFRDAVRIP